VGQYAQCDSNSVSAYSNGFGYETGAQLGPLMGTTRNKIYLETIALGTWESYLCSTTSRPVRVPSLSTSYHSIHILPLHPHPTTPSIFYHSKHTFHISIYCTIHYFIHILRFHKLHFFFLSPIFHVHIELHLIASFPLLTIPFTFPKPHHSMQIQGSIMCDICSCVTV
jgi:hypothetical protein